MIIKCENCGTRFKVDEARIRPEGSKARCSNCSRIFTVRRPTESQAEHAARASGLEAKKSGVNIVALSNQKGGVAKTTTCLNLGVSLSLLEKRVLLVDFDPQASLSSCLGFQSDVSFYDAVGSGDRSIDRAIRGTRYPNLWLLPSNKNMVMLNKNYFGSKNYEFVLKKKLKAVNRDFDFIFIDTPPSMEFCTLNALTASDLVIIPASCDFLATRGVRETVGFLSLIAQRSNPEVDYRILTTMYDGRDTVSRLICDKLKKIYGSRNFETVIEVDGKMKESQVMRSPVIYYYKHSRSALQYVTLAREVLGK